MAKSETKVAVKSENARKRSSMWANLLLLTVVTIATIALFEFGLRIAGYNPLANQPPKSIVELRLQTPHLVRTIDVSQIYPERPTARLRVDSRSYIMPSFQHENPDITIAFLGGSTTECAAVHESSRFSGLVSQLIGEHGLKANTLNTSRGGNTMQDSINVFLNHVIFDRPQIAVIMHAANDVGILAKHGDYEIRAKRQLTFADVVDWFKFTASENMYLAGVARQFLVVMRGRTSRSVPGDLNNRYRRTDPDFASTLPIELYAQRIRAFVHIARDFGVTPVLLTQPFSGSHNEFTPNWADLGSQDLFNEIIRQVGAEEQVLVIDLVRHLKEEIPDWDRPMNVFYDGLHITDFGSKVYAQHIADSLLPLAKDIISKRSTSDSISTSMTVTPLHSSLQGTILPAAK